jgi:hypothetical protein
MASAWSNLMVPVAAMVSSPVRMVRSDVVARSLAMANVPVSD